MSDTNLHLPQNLWKDRSDMGKMTVYHGGDTIIEKPKIIKGKNTKDFGYGFYCTIIREQAERWAKRYDRPVVSVYTVRMNTGLNILEFVSAEEVS